MKVGWVIKSKVNGKYYGCGDGKFCNHSLTTSLVSWSRDSARLLKKSGIPEQETVCKVALSKNGIPYKVLKTGQ